MRLLPDARPDIHLAIVEILAFPVEGAVMRRHRLDDEIMRLPEAVHQINRILVRGRDLVGNALDETHIEAAARDHVDGRELLGDAQRIGTMPDRIAEHQEPRLFGRARQNRKPDDDRRRHAGRGLMMLVEHDVEAEIVDRLVFVVIAVKQVGGDARIAFAIGKDHAQRAFMLVPGRVIGLFAELIDPHATRSCALPAKAKTFSANSFGCSSCGKCPARSTVSNFAPGIIAQ